MSDSKVKLQWLVTHEDGTIETENECKYHDLNRETIVMISLQDENGQILASLACRKENPFFYRKRVRQKVNKIVKILWLIGTRSRLVGIFDNGEIHHRDTFHENDEWFYPIKYREDEEDKRD